jgi:acyl-coenzyme A thioesterase PaaI-like protein
MPAANQFARVLGRIDRLPSPLARTARTALLRRFVPFVGTARLDIVELSSERCVVVVRNRPRVRNHIGTLHAAAVTLVAESASGLVVGLNVPDDRAPVMKSLRVEFKKRTKGGVRAEATLTGEQIEAIRSTERGEVDVAVKITDDAGVEAIEATMIWAWTPKRRG